MDKQESERYLLIKCDTEGTAHDFLVNWKYDGYFDVEGGVIIKANKENISEEILNALADMNYGVLLPLSDYEVITWSYIVLSKEDLIERKILKSNKGEADNLESTGS